MLRAGPFGKRRPVYTPTVTGHKAPTGGPRQEALRARFRVGAKAASPTEPHRGRFGTPPGFRDYRVGAKAASPTEPHRGRFGTPPGFRDYRAGTRWVPERSVFSFRYSLTMWRPT